MTQMPTPQELQLLAADIAKTGINAHGDAIAIVAEVTEKSGLFSGAAAVLRDASAPAALRSRAFVTIARNWTQIDGAAQKWCTFENSFEALANQSNEHHKLRSSGDLAALWSSRAKLDALRVNAATQRVAATR